MYALLRLQPRTRNELSRTLQVAPSQVYLSLSRLRRQGLVEIRGGHYPNLLWTVVD